MGTTAQKITYLGETKSILKDTINMSNANITNSTTFRNYATQLKEGYIDILNNGTDTLYNNFTHLTGKGMTLSFAPTYQAPMKITCYGSTSQASTPTPSSPVDVVNTTGNQSINVCGKNLFDKNNVINAFLNSDGTTTTNSTFRVCDYINVSNYEYITISGNSGSSELVCFYDENKNHINANVGMGSSTSKTITIPNEAVYMRATIKATILDEYQIEVGQSATTYEAYNGTNYNIGLGNIELCKIGDYEDKIDKSTGKNFIDNANVTYNYSNVSDSYNTLTTINTGIRYKTTYNNGSPVVVFKSIDLTNYVGKTIRFKANFGEKGRITLALCNADVSSRTAIQASTTSGNTITYVVPNNLGEQKYLAYYLGIVGATGNDTEDFTNLIITIDNEDMTYEPYGTDWYLKKNIGKVVLDGSESWAFSSSSAIKFRLNISNAIDFIDGNQNNAPLVFTNRYQPFAWNSASSYTNGVTANTNQLKYLCFKKNDITTLEAWQTDLATNNIIVYYPLATPTYTKITDSTLIEQLEAIKSKDNTTNITSSMVIGAVALKKE